jgi:hypothetical protein
MTADAKELLNLFKQGRKFTYHEEMFPNEIIEDNMIVHPNGNVAVGFEVSFPERESLGADEIRPFIEKLTLIIEQLPDRTALLFQNQYFHKQSTVDSLQKQQLGYLTSRLLDYQIDRPSLNQRSFVYLTFNFAKRKPNTPLTHFANLANWGDNPVQHISRYKQLAASTAESFKKNLESLKMIGIRMLRTEQLIEEQIKYFTLDFGGKPKDFTRNISNTQAGYYVGNKRVSFVHMQRTGSCVYDHVPNNRKMDTFMAWYMGTELNFPHVVNLAIRLDGKDNIMVELDKLRKRRIGTGRLGPVKDRSIPMEIELFLEQARQSERKIARFAHNVMVFDADSYKLDDNCNRVISAYLNMNGSIGDVDPATTHLQYHTFAPGYATEMINPHVLFTDEILTHFDFSSPHIAEQQGIILSNREGEPVLVDLWHPNLPSYNRVVIGPSGSGKSFTMGHILAQEIEQGVELVIIDVGGSYKNLFDVYANTSKYYEYKHEVPLSFNPFLLPKNRNGDFELSKDKIVFLTALITVLWKKTNEGETLSREEQSLLSRFLEQYYRDVNKRKRAESPPRLDGFIAFVKETVEKMKKDPVESAELKYFDIDSFLVTLKPFVEGVNKDILNSSENEDISSYRLVCFDLLGVQKDALLFPIVALLIMELVLDKIRQNPTVRKEIVIDEAWSMLSGALAEFIEMLYRTVRKSGGAVTIVSQDIGPIKKSAIGEAIRSNAPTKILLDHSSQLAMLGDLQGFFELTNHQLQKLMSIRNESHRREILLVRNNVAQNYFIDVGPHLTMAFSSRAEDRAKVQQLAAKGGIEWAIDQAVEDKLLHK